MTVEVELYRSMEYLRDGRQPLVPLLREVFEPLLGRELKGAGFVLRLLAVDDSDPLDGHPTVVNLLGGHGYAHVLIVENKTVIYQHPHTLREIVSMPLQRQLKTSFPDVAHWGFALVGPGLERLTMVRPTPVLAGQVNIRASRRRRVSHVEELAEPDPPATTLDALGVGDVEHPAGGSLEHPDQDTVRVVLSGAARRALTEHEFSEQVEEGGFLIGHRHTDRDRPGRDLLEVTEVVAAESTGASLLRFTFTGESFLRLGDLLARRGKDEHVLGWYHTHLFAATPEFGLSTVDVRLHTSTFRRPWQTAALVNLDGDHRTLRFYRSTGSGLTETPFWVARMAPT